MTFTVRAQMSHNSCIYDVKLGQGNSITVWLFYVNRSHRDRPISRVYEQ